MMNEGGTREIAFSQEIPAAATVYIDGAPWRRGAGATTASVANNLNHEVRIEWLGHDPCAVTISPRRSALVYFDLVLSIGTAGLLAPFILFDYWSDGDW